MVCTAIEGPLRGVLAAAVVCGARQGRRLRGVAALRQDDCCRGVGAQEPQEFRQPPACAQQAMPLARRCLPQRWRARAVPAVASPGSLWLLLQGWLLGMAESARAALRFKRDQGFVRAPGFEQRPRASVSRCSLPAFSCLRGTALILQTPGTESCGNQALQPAPTATFTHLPLTTYNTTLPH